MTDVNEVDPFDAIDSLISRVIDRRADDDAWFEIEAAAAVRPGAWRDVAEALWSESMLATRIVAAADAVDAVQLPSPRRRQIGLRSMLRVAAAATLFAVAFVVGRSSANETPVESLDASTHRDRYLDEGRRSGLVVGELPSLLIGAEAPASGDAGSMLVLRRIVEREDRSRLLSVEFDEHGRPRPVPMREVLKHAPTSF